MKRINWILVIILITGAVLRFLRFPHIPFTYDELSAWARTDYHSFSDLINKGVRGDGHPALIQAFLYYWRKIFGDTEASFKLPFLLMGIASIYLVFQLGKNWFNETVGMVCAGFISVLQYTVMYSQIARPYISGLFFSLMMVLCWSKYFFVKSETNRKRYIIGFVIFATLCCYNHYFSLLFAFVVGISGFFFLSKKNISEYFIACLAIVFLFLPHLGISLDQLAIGGVGGWLSKPDKTFFGNYLFYIFDFSGLLTGLAVAISVTGLVFLPPDWKQKNKFRLLCLAWFIIPLLTGYFYSVLKNPVLQYSVLIFSFPFLLLFIFSFLRNLKIWQQGILAVSILTTGIYSLVAVRKHYEIFYRQPVEQMVTQSIQFAKDHPGKKTLVIIQEPEKYMGYYLKKYNSDLKILSWQDLNFQSYSATANFLAAQNADYVLCGNIPYDHLIIFQDFYPVLIKSDKGFTYEFFCYGKSNLAEQKINDIAFEDTLNINNPGDFWSLPPAQVQADSVSGPLQFHFDSAHEFGPTFTAWLYDIMKQRDDILLVDFMVDHISKDPGASLVISFEQQRNISLYQEKPFKLFIDSASTSAHLVYAFRFRDYEFTKTNPLLKAYIWNKAHESFDVVSMKISIMKGNPLIYSLIEPLKE